jgi:two-component system cell cycle sensor histidine kinase/response regulator CckA
MHESEWQHKNGSLISVLENVQAFHDDADKLQYFEGTVQDITPLRVLQQQLQLSQKMEIIGIMASRIAHELNNKLTTILGYADLCAIKLPKDHEIYKYIQHIQNYSKHSAGVIQQLLKFSRKPEAQAPTTFDIHEFLQERREIIEAICTRSITVLTHSELVDSIVFADKKQFEQVVINLVINARDAMAEGGTLTFKLSNEHFQQSTRNSRVAPHGDYIKISVIDTGSGIPEKNMAKIFEPFFTTKKEGVGTGLGLSIVKGIIESNNGFIQVSSTAEMGTTFDILLPVFKAED